jgi:hypothetical protein
MRGLFLMAGILMGRGMMFVSVGRVERQWLIFLRWLRKGFLEPKDFQRSWAEAELRDVEVLNKAAHGFPDRLEVDEKGNVVIDSDGYPIVAEYGFPPNWRVSAWRLERKFPERWGRRTRGEHMLFEDKSSISVVFVDTE